MTLPANHPRHAQLMQVAVRRALRAVGRTAPNPCVGSVVAREGRIVAVGHHARAGQPHAEMVALARAGSAARGADLYVTLEPCSHHGRTPPCADAVVAAGIARVFVAMEDPNPKVHGAGLERLRSAGVEVVLGPGAPMASTILAPFAHWVANGTPLVILKAAISLDGRLATSQGASHGLSGPRAHAWLHRLRDRVDAIMVGAGTATADNPQLTCRRVPVGPKGPHQLRRVVLDSLLKTSPLSALAQGAPGHPTTLFCLPSAPQSQKAALQAAGVEVVVAPAGPGGVDLSFVLTALGARGVQAVLVEGGAGLHASLLSQQRAQHAMLVVAPVFLGATGVPLAAWEGPPTLAQAVRLEPLNVRRLGADTLLFGAVRYPGQMPPQHYNGGEPNKA